MKRLQHSDLAAPKRHSDRKFYIPHRDNFTRLSLLTAGQFTGPIFSLPRSLALAIKTISPARRGVDLSDFRRPPTLRLQSPNLRLPTKSAKLELSQSQNRWFLTHRSTLAVSTQATRVLSNRVHLSHLRLFVIQ